MSAPVFDEANVWKCRSVLMASSRLRRDIGVALRTGRDTKQQWVVVPPNLDETAPDIAVKIVASGFPELIFVRCPVNYPFVPLVILDKNKQPLSWDGDDFEWSPAITLEKLLIMFLVANNATPQHDNDEK